ncbi:MAG: transporter [Zetaproteobacteria bacterium CG12_big_fil_rev_8_21_14_0_65_54_13]|nr:MAG: transporter [Zetaproteobacteria bacterium CG12_big_fil_rev_8_21_14_0_65_54_13]PIX55735.1 MAG: transporter [Zetaproteobacteria bacterium CG_4_10_14_3_um_filter_54_28]PJA30547.1 MAG: transporter [Zetaproteobacteria bacterium CG_4_9_14_3_um_filter_54_145]
MNVSAWIQGHRRSLLTLLLLFAAIGAVRAFQMPVGLFPNVTFPRIVVTLNGGDQPAEQMEIQVTRQAEMAIRSVPGVVNLRSTTSRGSAEISVNFDWGTDMISTALQVSAAIAQIQAQLPVGTSFTVRRMDPTVFPVLAYSLTSQQASQTALRDLTMFQIVPLLSSGDGVARVAVLGGNQEEYRVTLHAGSLQAFGISLQQVASALAAGNVLTAVGRIEDRYKLFLTVSDTRFDSLDAIRHTVLASGDNGNVELEDIASVTRSVQPQWLRVTADNRDAVLFMVYQQPGGNTVKIAADVRARMEQFKSKLPAGVTVKNWYDQSRLVVASARSVLDAILIGIALAALVLFVFLRNLRVTLITLIAVPAVFATTVLLLDLFHFSFNIMTLGGMAAAVGLVIDDAIVMIEQIIRRLRGSVSACHERTIMQAATAFFQPLLGSSLATTIIFLPLAFLDGVTGAFFKALSLTMASALIVSFLIAWLAVPLLATHLLREKDAADDDEGPIQTRILAVYTGLLGRMLQRPAMLLVIAVALLVTGYGGYRAVGSGFMPHMDEGGFIFDYIAPPGMSLTETDRLLQQVETILHATPEVDTYARRTGAQLGGGLTEANQGDIFVRLKPLPRRSIDDIMDEIRDKVHAAVPALDIDMALLMEDVIGDLTSNPQPIEIKLFGDDPQQLDELAPKVAEAIGHIDGVVDVRDGIMIAGDAIAIKVDRARAALEGLDPDQVTRQVNTLLAGLVTTTVQQGQKMIDVRLWSGTGERDAIYKLGRMQLQAPDGHWLPLKRIAAINTITGQAQITRENLKRMVAVTGRISGRDMGSVMHEVKALIATKLIPNDVRVELGGLYLQQQKAFQGLTQVFAAAVALVFVLLLFLYERFRAALAILAMPLLAMGMVFLGLAVTDTELNITSMMGLTMIIGIVTETAIFYYSEFRRISPPEALHRLEDYIQAGRNRLRPIAMTTLAAILALMPLALAFGEGSTMLQPMAIAIIFGLAAQLPLVLLVLPALLFWLDRKAGLVQQP